MQKWEKLPGDLLACVIFAIATLFFTLLPPLSDLPVRIPLGLLMVLFVPGYNLIAALFPRRDDLDGIERVALSFGLSIAVVPLMGLGLNYTPWGIRLTPVVVSISLFTIVMAAAAYFRRMSLPLDERFSVEFRKGLDSAKAELLADERSRLDKALTILLILSIILSVSALAYVVVTPKQGEKFTEFYILGPKGKAYDYPTKVIAGNKSTLIVGVVNHEYSTVNYTMRLAFDRSIILEQETKLEHNQTWERPVTYVLSHPGDEQKLEFLLYKEYNFTAPYRDLHLWVNVSMPGGGLQPAQSVAPEAHMNISPVSPLWDDGSGGGGDSGGAANSLLSAGQIQLAKGGMQNATNASAALAKEQNNTSTRINESADLNISKVFGNGSYNLANNMTNGSAVSIKPGLNISIGNKTE